MEVYRLVAISLVLWVQFAAAAWHNNTEEDSAAATLLPRNISPPTDNFAGKIPAPGTAPAPLCNATVPRGSTLWKSTPTTVDVTFPKMKPPKCVSPTSCTINSTLHAHIILQPGDSLRLTFDLSSSGMGKGGAKVSSALDTAVSSSSAKNTNNDKESRPQPITSFYVPLTRWTSTKSFRRHPRSVEQASLSRRRNFILPMQASLRLSRTAPSPNPIWRANNNKLRGRLAESQSEPWEEYTTPLAATEPLVAKPEWKSNSVAERLRLVEAYEAARFSTTAPTTPTLALEESTPNELQAPTGSVTTTQSPPTTREHETTTRESDAYTSPVPATTWTTAATAETTTPTRELTTLTTTTTTTAPPPPSPAPNVIVLYRVDADAFETCDVVKGQEVGRVSSAEDKNQGSFVIESTMLAIGSNYFLGRSATWGGECIKVRAVVKTADCGDREVCSDNGICYATSALTNFQCSCCDGASDHVCSRSNPCNNNPCLHEGVCVRNPRSEEEPFRCLCLPGYHGRFCEDNWHPCDPSPCRNGGTCIAAGNTPHCSCPPGFVGLNCEEELTGCDSSPCIHGICVDQPKGYRCFCQPGFGGARCDYEYNECQSSPCVNGGTCLDKLGSFECHCLAGFTGTRCEIKANLCVPNPCPSNRICLEQGGNITCECPMGIDCTDTPTVCNPNPCLHGGTCWISSGSFYCACASGYSGVQCQELDPAFASFGGLQMELEDLELKSPLSLHLDHTHSIYVAVGTLAGALIVVLLTVSVCYCRVHETYKRWSPRRFPSLCRDYRFPVPNKDDYGMDVPLAVAMDGEGREASRYQKRGTSQRQCNIYWSHSRKGAAVLD